MSIEIISDSRCDAKGCGIPIDIGDNCYCKNCYRELLGRASDLERDLEKANEDIRSFKEKIGVLEKEISQLEGSHFENIIERKL
jgi:hypothetical protein